MKKTSSSGRKIVSAVLLTIGIMLVLYSAIRKWHGPNPNTVRYEQLRSSWMADVARLREAKAFPPEIDDISDLKFDMPEGPLKQFVTRAHPAFTTKPEGKFELHLFMDEMPTEKGVILRYDLVNKATGNTVWEVSRSLPVKLSP